MLFSKIYFQKMSEFERLVSRFEAINYVYIDHYYSESRPIRYLTIQYKKQDKKVAICGIIWFRRTNKENYTKSMVE